MENNVSELKEALESTANVLAAIADAFEKGTGGVPIQEVNKALEDANKALELPLRNCDVGTPEEQYQRYEKFCCRYYRISDNGSGNCLKCPLSQPVCKLAWAQMPYEEGE